MQAEAIYKYNVYESNGHRWWCSSASPQPDVRRYHEYFVQSAQAEQRLHDQRVLIDHYLAHNQCWYIETSYSEQEAFSRQNRFDLIRGNEVQPKPMVHFHFVKERVLSKLPWPIDQSRVDRLEAALQNHDWPAHDPNKDHVWQKITSDLDIV